MRHYYLTKQGYLRESPIPVLDKFDSNILDFWSVDPRRRSDLWGCLLEAMAKGVRSIDAKEYCVTYGMHGQDLLEVFGRMKYTPLLKKGVDRYLIEFLKIKEPIKFYTWMSKQNPGPGRVVDFFLENA